MIEQTDSIRNRLSQREKNVKQTNRFVFGLGSGRCGLRSFGYLLHHQKETAATHIEWPILVWMDGQEGDLLERRIRSRMTRMMRERNTNVVADTASFYLPYASCALDSEHDVRMVCLKRDKEQTVRSFIRYLDRTQPLPTNHWSRVCAPGWSKDIIWSRMYPKYEETDREKALERYYDEYYEKAEELANRYPDRFRIFDTDSTLNTPDGQRELLTFCGYELESLTMVRGLRENETDSLPFSGGPCKSATHDQDPRRCVVLVPFSGHIVPGCEDALRELERRGYAVRRIGGYAAIDQGRNQMASDALTEGFEETMWIDSDVVFDPGAVDKLRMHRLPVSSAIYPQKGKRALASHVMPGIERMKFGKNGTLQELLYAATGFLHVRRSVYETLQEKLGLPVCNERFLRPTIPFFAPMVNPIDEGHWYLAEDYAFSERLRQCGYKIFADTSIRLWHVGSYFYGWEDAGMEPPRFDEFTLNFTDRPEASAAPLPLEKNKLRPTSNDQERLDHVQYQDSLDHLQNTPLAPMQFEELQSE